MSSGKSPIVKIIDAIDSNDPVLVDALFKQFPECRDIYTPFAGATWLHYAARQGSNDVIEYLLALGMSVNIGDEMDQAVQRLYDFEQCSGSEGERDAMLSALDRMVPHADISDLIYYAERERTHEEIAEEALLRERIWAEHGEMAVRARIEAQLLEALADSSVPDHHYTKISARTLLQGMRGSSAH